MKHLRLLLFIWLSVLFPLSAFAQTTVNPQVGIGAYQPQSGGGGGSGTVTSVSVTSANGLAGTVSSATTTPAITLSTTITGLLKGGSGAISAATAGTDYQAPITLTTTGTSGAATFSGNTLNIPQYVGGVSSITGDGTIISNSASTGAVTLTQANAAGYTIIGNNTASSAAPTATYGMLGSTVLSSTGGTTTLTANSPSVMYCNTALASNMSIQLPLASTCPGKEFTYIRGGTAGGSFTTAFTLSGSDTFSPSGASVTAQCVNSGPEQTCTVVSQGANNIWLVELPAILSLAAGGTGNNLQIGANANYVVICTGQNTLGLSNTPGATTPLASVTSALVTAPTFVNAITADTDGSTITFNLATSNWHSVTLGGNRTLAFSNVTTGEDIDLLLTQDGTGSRTVTWPSGITWSYGGSAPTLQTTAGATDTIHLKCYGTNLYYGYPVPSTSGGGGGGVSSFTGDSVVLSNSASTGAVTATLANAAAGTVLGNSGTSAAAPAYVYSPLGYATSSTNNTLTASSPSYQVITSTNTVTLPVASTCIGKVFEFAANGSFSGGTIATQASDLITAFNGTSTTWKIGAGCAVKFYAQGTNNWVVFSYNQYNSFSSAVLGQAAGGLAYFGSSAFPQLVGTPAGTSGQLIQSAATGTPTWTSTPGSGTTLTSITVTHQIAAGTAPTVAAGAGAGGSPTITIASGSGGTAHDTDFLVTLTSGTLPTGTNAVIFTVTFGTTFASAPCVQVTPANAGAATLMTAVLAPYATSTATTMVLNAGTTGLAAATSYSWYVHCSQ